MMYSHHVAIANAVNLNLIHELLFLLVLKITLIIKYIDCYEASIQQRKLMNIFILFHSLFHENKRKTIQNYF